MFKNAIRQRVDMRPTFYCSNPWTTLFIWGNGDATHCCYSNWGAVGNIHRQTIDEIWHGPKITALRSAMIKNDFLGAGCEPYCRVFRWNDYYGSREKPPVIPPGLGRMADYHSCQATSRPAIIGLATSWRCNLHCTHCQAPRNVDGLNDSTIAGLWPWVESAKIVRIMDGEFTVNPQSLQWLERIARMAHQPLVFMNTNGQVPMAGYWKSVEKLQAFHLKFSLEGLSAEYEKVRRGGTWSHFSANLIDAQGRFADRRNSGVDWRLFLNYCVMRSNFSRLPEAVAFAVELRIPLVLNALYGARHIEENFGMYQNATVKIEEVDRVEREIHSMLSHTDYPFSADLLQHLDYITRVMKDPRKMVLPESWRKRWRRHSMTPLLGQILYLGYLGRFHRRAFLIRIGRKLRKHLHMLVGS
jgi:MoaA/NifB/PqqE/SkfB family radical SAM enzyme